MMKIEEIISLLHPSDSDSFDIERRDYDMKFLQDEENMKRFSYWFDSSYRHPETIELSPEDRVKMMMELTKRDVYSELIGDKYNFSMQHFIMENIDDIDRNLIEFGKIENNLGLNQNEIMAFAVNRVKLNPQYVEARKKRDLLKYKKHELAVLEAEVKDLEIMLGNEQTKDISEE